MIEKEIICIKNVPMGRDYIAFTKGRRYQAQIFNESIQAWNNINKIHIIDCETLKAENFFKDHFIFNE